MKNCLFITLLAALFCGSCKKSDSFNKDVAGCPIDPAISNGYLNDAQEIVYRNILAGVSVQGSDQVAFNQQELNKVLSAIQSVYALNSPQTDTVFNVYKIHAFKLYVLNSIILQVNLNAPEIKNLAIGQPTGNSSFDTLMAKYGFTYNNNTLYPSTSQLPFFAINSNTWYNIQALVPLFKQYSFILGAQSNGTAGDGNNITYQINGTNRILDFSLGFGDCPAGCGGRQIWEFSVDEHCKATFVKSFLQ
jgi:hypothetical protein